MRVTYQHTSACGTLRSADNGQIRLTVIGNHDPIAIPLNQVTNLAVLATCR
ncbi:MAG: hypothetical protein ACRDRO_16340 [Pseudonocardiaceae bacterium]